MRQATPLYEHTGITPRRVGYTVTSERGAGGEPVDIMAMFNAAKPAWMRREDRNCNGVDPRVFYGENSHRAIVICEGCPVQQQCLDYALENYEWGIWGGTSERERKRIRRHGDPRTEAARRGR